MTDCVIIGINGYISVIRNKRTHPLHRVLYEADYGILPKGFVVHHTCSNKGCINIEHLVALTNKDHSIIHKQKTYCKRGHLLKPENLYVYGDRRLCKVCFKVRYSTFKSVQKLLTEITEL